MIGANDLDLHAFGRRTKVLDPMRAATSEPAPVTSE
jgi:hypothetical protein